jgi:hypothetical protein
MRRKSLSAQDTPPAGISNMSKPVSCQHVLVYVPVLGGYDVACRNCGEVYGHSESPDPDFLAGLNRNRAAKGTSSGRKRHRKTARAR